jgi:urease accessory protein
MRKFMLYAACGGPAALLLAPSAHAHHAMEYGTPATAVDGLLSGIAHPVIGFDHLLFVLALGAACYLFGQRRLSAAAFLTAAMGGTLVHVYGVGLIHFDVWVAASLLAFGLILIAARGVLRSPAAPVLFAAAGAVHGYAYGEAIVGAETTPLVAYLAGFTLVQMAIAAAGFALARYVAGVKPRALAFRSASVLLVVGGCGALVLALVT